MAACARFLRFELTFAFVASGQINLGYGESSDAKS